MNNKLISGDGFLCSPGMEDFCKRMVAQERQQMQINEEIRLGLRPAPSRHFGYWNISDRH